MFQTFHTVNKSEELSGDKKRWFLPKDRKENADCASTYSERKTVCSLHPVKKPTYIIQKVSGKL